MTVECARCETFGQALAEFDRAWHHPGYTAIELPPVDVNAVLARRYVVDPEIVVTRDQVWELELRKAWDPMTYIPYVADEGTCWAVTDLRDGARGYLRSSMQRGWIDDSRGRVLEEVVADPVGRRILFLGRERMTGRDGTELRSAPGRPLFHVEHGAAGTPDAPTNTWRIVLLTEGRDDRYRLPFDEMARAGRLPGYLEIYLERDLGVKLHRR